MAKIESGVGTDLLTVDPVSKAARITLYDSAGNEITGFPITGSVEISNDAGNPLPVSASSLPLPTGASTSSNQTTGNASLTSIDTKTPALSSGRVPVDGSGVTQPISASSLPLPTGAAQDSTLTGGTVRTKITDGTNNAAVKSASVSAVATDPALVVAISPNNTIPISASALPLPSGASTSAKQPSLGVAGTPSTDVLTVQGAISMTALKVDGSGVTQPVSGTVTANAGTNLNTSALALETGGNLASIKTNTDNLNFSQASTTLGQKGPLIQGAVSISAPSYANGQTDPFSLTTAGSLRTDSSSTTQPISASALPLPSGASTAAKQPALGTGGSPSTDVITVQGISSGTALKVDGSAVTQPISASALPLPTGASTEATLALIKAKTDNLDVLLSTRTKPADSQTVTGTVNSGLQVGGTNVGNANPVPVSDAGGSLTVDGTVSAAQSGSWSVNQGGTWIIGPTYLGQYILPIEVIPTTLVDGTTYWTMRNLGANRVFIRRIELNIGFTGTAAASRSLFRFERFSTATPTAGTALTVIKGSNTFGNSSVTDARFAPGGLTTTSVVFETAFDRVGINNQLSGDFSHITDFQQLGEENLFTLAVGEGIAIRAYGAVVLGSYITGKIRWSERV